jgi:hypothetical protein
MALAVLAATVATGQIPPAPSAAAGDPGPPGDVRVAAEGRSLTLTWAPGTGNGSTILGYRACAGHEPTAELPVEETCQDLGPDARKARFEGLRGGMEYYSGVRTHVPGSSSVWATAGNVTLDPAGPAAPRNAPVIGAGGRGVWLTWDTPFDGGSPITANEVCASTSPAFNAGPATCALVGTNTTATVRGLEPGTLYYARVRAINAHGPGEWSPVTPFGATPYPEISSPKTVLVEAASRPGVVVVRWPSAEVPVEQVIGWIVTPHVGAVALPPRRCEGWQPTCEIDGLSGGTTYAFSVQGVNDAGTGPASPRSDPVAPIGPSTPDPFATLDAFVAHLLADFTGSPGSAPGRASTVAQLANGSTGASAFIDSLRDHPWHAAAVPPTARLYWAYFGRIPDHNGLEYWAKKRRAGTTLIRISASFAGSSEFKRTYGALSNEAFVDLVYQNVLGRPGDAGGRAFWTGKLDRGTSRGQVMINFSESGEYIRKTAARVGVVEVFGSMLDRAPTSDELTTWGSEPIRNLIDAVRLGAEYAGHVS